MPSHNKHLSSSGQSAYAESSIYQWIHELTGSYPVKTHCSDAVSMDHMIPLRGLCYLLTPFLLLERGDQLVTNLNSNLLYALSTCTLIDCTIMYNISVKELRIHGLCGKWQAIVAKSCHFHARVCVRRVVPAFSLKRVGGL